jgi:hypothetical protein
MTEPKLLTEVGVRALLDLSTKPDQFRNYLREQGLIAEEPVDPLMEALSWAVGQHFDMTDEQLADIVDEARAKGVGMELAERPPLTRRMVRNAVVISRPFTDDLGNDGRFIDRLHAALVERMTQGEG